MKSANFEILRGKWPELAELGGFAEAYAHADPASALVKLRSFAENLTKDVYRDLRLPKPDQPTFIDLRFAFDWLSRPISHFKAFKISPAKPNCVSTSQAT